LLVEHLLRFLDVVPEVGKRAREFFRNLAGRAKEPLGVAQAKPPLNRPNLFSPLHDFLGPC
jgi:hypothetical protein